MYSNGIFRAARQLFDVLLVKYPDRTCMGIFVGAAFNGGVAYLRGPAQINIEVTAGIFALGELICYRPILFALILRKNIAKDQEERLFKFIKSAQKMGVSKEVIEEIVLDAAKGRQEHVDAMQKLLERALKRDN